MQDAAVKGSSMSSDALVWLIVTTWLSQLSDQVSACCRYTALVVQVVLGTLALQ